jgi:hypothetical protein
MSAGDRDVTGNILLGVLWGVLILTLTTGVVGVTQAMNEPNDYARGYCAALGGTVLNTETCNVEGKVMTIQKEE